MSKYFDMLAYLMGKQAGGGGGGDVTVESKSISSNGTYTAPSGKAYSPVTVSVPASAVDSGTKSITSNGNNQDVVGYAAVDVAVPNSYAAGDEGKVVSNGALVAQTAHAKVTQNGTIDTTLNNSVEVDVPSGGTPDTASVHVTTSTEMTLKDLLQNYPIPLKYESEMCWLWLFNDSAPTNGGCTKWVQFNVHNLTKLNQVTAYSNNNVSPNSQPYMGDAIVSNNGNYYNITDYKITNSGSTNTTRLIPSGTVCKVVHIPFDFDTLTNSSTML